jgi:transposase
VSKARLVITAVVVQGRGVRETARSYTVSPGWVSRLVARYRVEGEAAFEPRSRRPYSQPRAIPAATAELIIRLRDQLARQGLDAGSHTMLGTWSSSIS